MIKIYWTKYGEYKYIETKMADTQLKERYRSKDSEHKSDGKILKRRWRIKS